ncbi:MAG TPA: S8 family peptidase [Oscillospiraceae bacterium]|nr:S8 family peptidase [Oscillospiraceae bacterium]
MIYQDVKWIRTHGAKLAPSLRKHILAWYRPASFTPCFINNLYTNIIQKWRKIPVIVQLDDSAPSTLSLQSISQTTGCKVQKDLSLLHAFSTKVDRKTLQALAEDPKVVRIWYDEEIHAVLDTASPTVQAASGWEEGVTGKDVTIAIIDTGVYNHADLAGRIVGFVDLVGSKQQPYDDNGHGTHVAGCAAANGKQSAGKYKAPAPEANIVGVKVLSKTGSGSLSTVIQGVQWCIDNQARYKIRILNLSLGSETYQSYQDDPVGLAVAKAWDSGLIVCVAAGNSGPEARTVNSPGNHPKVLTVGALDDGNTSDNDDDQIAGFSSRGPTADELNKPDVVAPGVNIIALRSPGAYLDKQNKKARIEIDYLSLSGTSMATPVCAGAIAVLLEKDPTLTPERVKQLLQATATRLPEYGDNDQGSGLINLQRALQELNPPLAKTE